MNVFNQEWNGMSRQVVFIFCFNNVGFILLNTCFGELRRGAHFMGLSVKKPQLFFSVK